MTSLMLSLRSGYISLIDPRISAARSMSISLVRKKCGTGPSDVTRRRAIVRRISLAGSSRYADGPYTAASADGRGKGRKLGLAPGWSDLWPDFRLMADSMSFLI